MISAIITLLTALSLAAVAGWFSIIGFTTIYAGAVIAAVIMGAVTETAKVVTTSWLYRNWDYSSWLIKAPLIFFTLVLMVITSLGVFGFLSKAHLDQGASTVDNAAKIEQIEYQISREQALIADAEKVISQLDTTVNSLIERNLTNRSISVRRSQESTRKQLRKDIADAQQRIDSLNKEKFTYESEIRNLELEIGPIKYIAELLYDENAADKDVTKSAVQLFTLLIVITLDPLAVVLIIAANQTLVRLQEEKNQPNKVQTDVVPVPVVEEHTESTPALQEDIADPTSSLHAATKHYLDEVAEGHKTEENNTETMYDVTSEQEIQIEHTADPSANTVIQENNSPVVDKARVEAPMPWATQEEVLRELMGSNSVPIESDISQENTEASFDIVKKNNSPENKYPAVKSWLKEFTGDRNGRK